VMMIDLSTAQVGLVPGVGRTPELVEAPPF
jgi:hypothetical protein